MEKEIANDNLDTPTDPAYVQGFNEGYILAEYLPDLADLLYKVTSSSERMAGFKAGREEYVLEKMHEKIQDWEKNERPTEKDLGLDKTINDLEKDWEK